MTQTFTLKHDDVLKSPEKLVISKAEGAEPSARVLQNILAFSRNLEVKNSSMLKHVNYLKS